MRNIIFGIILFCFIFLISFFIAFPVAGAQEPQGYRPSMEERQDAYRIAVSNPAITYLLTAIGYHCWHNGNEYGANFSIMRPPLSDNAAMQCSVDAIMFYLQGRN